MMRLYINNLDLFQSSLEDAETFAKILTVKEHNLNQMRKKEEIFSEQYRYKIVQLKADIIILRSRLVNTNILHGSASRKEVKQTLLDFSADLRMRASAYRVNFERNAFFRVALDIDKVIEKLDDKNSQLKETNEVVSEDLALFRVKIEVKRSKLGTDQCQSRAYSTESSHCRKQEKDGGHEKP